MSGFFSRLFGSRPRPRLPELPGPVAPDGFYDMTFAVTEIAEDGTLLRLSCRATADGKTVGFDLTLPRHIDSGLVFVGDGNVSFSPKARLPAPVTLIGLGEPSTGLAATMAARSGRQPQDLSAYPDAPGSLPNALPLTGIHLEAGDRDLHSQTTRIKVFFEMGDPAFDQQQLEGTEQQPLYAEAFLIPDLANGVIHLHDKDYAYRPVIIDILTAAWR